MSLHCDAFTDLFDLYAIGSLEVEECDALRSHLAGGCELCSSRVDLALMQAALISGTVPLVEPPASLKQRIAATVNGSAPVVLMPSKKSPSRLPWLAALAAAAALVVGVGLEENARRRQSAVVAAAVEASNTDAQRTAAMLNILQAPGTKQISFKINQNDLPQGSLFIHKNLGVAMVVAHLPAAPEGWKYESWVVPKSGTPRPVESFATNKAGVAITVVKGPVDVTQWTAMAVSMEPESSTPVKPTKVLFASPVG